MWSWQQVYSNGSLFLGKQDLKEKKHKPTKTGLSVGSAQPLGLILAGRSEHLHIRVALQVCARTGVRSCLRGYLCTCLYG